METRKKFAPIIYGRFRVTEANNESKNVVAERPDHSVENVYGKRVVYEREIRKQPLS